MNPKEGDNSRYRHLSNYQKLIDSLPKPGSKLRYKGTSTFWFTNIIENAERELRVGEIYTVQGVELASSWTAVTLVETGDVEYCLSFFERMSDS